MKTLRPILNVILCIFCFQALQAQTSKKPNIIFIFADDIGYDVPTVNGGQSFSTPYIDSMAMYGMNFTHCEATPLCCPSRFMFLTGKQNFRNYNNWGYMNQSEQTVGNLMRDAGYATGFFGKLQLQYSPELMYNWGWNKYTIFEVSEDTLPERRYKSPNLIDEKGRVPESITRNKYCDDILTNRILNFIDSNKTKPFFVYYSMSIAHDPFQPTPDDPEYATWNPNSGVSDTSFFPSMIKYMDKKVGQILTKLKNVGLDTSTIVFFVGDNGTPIPIRYKADGIYVTGKKGKTMEAGTHVPMIAYWPKHITPHGINDDLIDFTDFFPTFANLAKYKNLSKYGVLDGVSFYNRLFKKTDSVRQNLFLHYVPNPGLDILNRWVRSKGYKLYDSTGSDKAGKFFNIQADKQERHPLLTSQLTKEEANIKDNFKHILDTMSSWPPSPFITNAFASDISSNSVTLTATIINSGASNLVEQGSTLSSSDTPYYRYNRQEDSAVTLGTFSQKRYNLAAQKRYRFTLYAMNANSGNSTAYDLDSFVTLSRPPVQQPTSLTILDNMCSISVSWNDASYPAKGATRGGYILLYSTKAIVLNSNANGKSPASLCNDSKCRRINLSSALPVLPPTNTNIGGLSKDSLYYFKLVPYTWDGSIDATYNYLIINALSTTKRPVNNGCRTAPETYADQSTAIFSSKTSIMPNPSSYVFTLQIDKAYINDWISVRVSDAAGKTYNTIEGKGRSQYTFGSNLRSGVYFVYVKAGKSSFTFKIIKD